MMNKLTMLILFLLILLPMRAIADPTPFGIQVGKSTLEEVKAKYNVTTSGAITKCSGHVTYKIDEAQVVSAGTLAVYVAITSEGKVASIKTQFPKKKFRTALEAFSKQYRLDFSRFTDKGKKSVHFIDGHTDIEWKPRYQFISFSFYEGTCHHIHKKDTKTMQKSHV